MKDFVELFEACGGKRDGDSVTIPTNFEPIDIVLKVIPVTIETYKDTVGFHVLIDDQLSVDDRGFVRETSYHAEVELPIEAVHLAPKIEEENGGA